MAVDGYYRGKTVLVTGADGVVAAVLVRELLRGAYESLAKVYVLVDPVEYAGVHEEDAAGAGAAAAPPPTTPPPTPEEEEDARAGPPQFADVAAVPAAAAAAPAPTRAVTKVLRKYAAHPAFASLYEDSPAGREWFDEYLAAKVEVLAGVAASGTSLGLDDADAARLHSDVDVIFFGDGLVDPCDVDVDPDALHRAGVSVSGFASKCGPRAVLVLPASLYAAAVGRRFRSAPLEYQANVPETPAIGIRGTNVEEDAGVMPSRVVAAAAAIETTVSSLAVQEGTACVAVVRHGLIGPPLFAPLPHAIIGGLDALAFTVQVGAVTRLAVPKSSLLEVVPADVLADRLLAAPLRLNPAAVGDQRVVVTHAATTSVHPLAARMAGGYFTEYYARNAKALAASLDYGTPSLLGGSAGGPIRVPLSPLLAPTPIISIGRVWDVDGVTNLPKLAVLKANEKVLGRGVSHLAKHPHAAAAARYRTSLRRSVEMVKVLEKCLCLAGKARFDTSVFDAESESASPFIDPREIEWETYCKTVSQMCFAHLCRCLGIDPPALPPPVKYCDMDSLTVQPGMQFSKPLSLLQVLFPDLHFLFHCTQQPDGCSVKYTPGLTPLRRSEVLAYPTVAKVIDEQAKKENVEREAIVERANAILDRIGDKLNVRTIRVLGLALRKVMQIIYDHVHVNVDGYEMVRRAISGIGSINPTGKRAVVLIPSHRSYMDFLVVSYLMYMWGLPVPHICAGEDFLRLAAVSKLLRGSGAFFMRRSFKGDPLYGSLFREYARRMATDGRVIEFFIEGTRSRSGKTMGPKVGILKIMVESLLDGLKEGHSDLADVVFVPISLSYDKLLEGNIYVRELFGGKKPPETVRNLLGAASVLRSKFGCLNVTVGQPVSLAEYLVKGDRGEPAPAPKLTRPAALLKDRPDTVTAAYDPSALLRKEVERLDAGRKREVLNTLAWRITANLQAGLVVTPTALLSAVLLYMHLPSELEEGVKLDTVANEVVWVREQVLQSGGQMKKDVVRGSGEDLTSYAAGLTGGRVVFGDFGGVSVPEEDSLLLLWVYANQLVHLFSDRSVFALAALSLPGEEHVAIRRDPSDKTEQEVTMHRVSLQAVHARSKYIKDLLCIEFPNYRAASPLPHDAWFDLTLAASLDHGVERDGAAVSVPRNAVLVQFLCNLLYPLVECYYAVAAALTLLMDGQKHRQPHLVEKIGSSIAGLAADGLIQYSIAGNREVLRNAMARLREMGLVQTDGTASQAVTLPPAVAADDAKTLHEAIATINALRWKPCKDLSASVAAIAAAVGAAATPAKL